MTEAKLVAFKFKNAEGKRVWLNWAEELKHRREEVIATLKNEGVVSESCFMSEDGERVYYFMEAEDMKKARATVEERPHPIDAEHKQARESGLEFIAELDCLFHFDNR